VAAPGAAFARQRGRRAGHRHAAADPGDRPQAAGSDAADRLVRACLQPAAAIAGAGSGHRSVTELEAGIRKWISEWNKDPRPFIWTKTADEILETLAAYCERIIGSRH